MFRITVLSFLFTVVATVCAGADAQEIRPVAVWSPTPTQPPGQATLDKLIDGDWNTVCCFLDDTPTGKDLKTTTTKGDQPITARFVLDLGNPQEVSGIRFVAQKSWANYMAENVTVFACDDREGKVNVHLLKDQCHLPPVNSLNAAFVTWKPVTARYVGVQVNDSFGRSHGGLDWWRGADPRQSRQEWRCNEKLKYNFGWNWGAMLSAIRTLPQVAGGPLYDAGAAQNQFVTQIAEVSCFCGKPADMPSPNAPEVAFPEHRLQRDWMYQDCGVKNASMVANSTDASTPDPIGPDISQYFVSKRDSVLEQAMVECVLAELKQAGVDVAPLERRRRALSSAPGNDARWKALYFEACRQRRRERLKTVRRWASQFIYVKHFVFGCWTFLVPSDDVSDEQLFERSHDFHGGSQLCLATVHEDGTVTNEVVLEKPDGVIRDANLSFDAKTLVFSMRDNFKTDDYHLYTMDMAPRKVRQITFSQNVGGTILPCSDTSPCFIPSGDLVFQSTRCVQMDVCWAHPTSNLYTCDVEGRYVRRLAFDQVGTMTPQTLEDGRVIYTRWEYMDRNPFYLQSLFVMNADGTGQTALYGNNSIYPAALIHARGIPDTEKIITVVSGHHVLQKGKLAIIDRSKGSEGDCGIEYVAGASPDGKPGRQPSNVHPPLDRLRLATAYDFFGQIGPQWQYPYAFDEEHYLVAFNPEGYHFLKGPFNPPFGVYYMTADGRRELLAFDWGNSCGQAIPVMATKRPPVKPSSVDWSKRWGSFYIQNVYAGPGLEGVKKGTVKRLRVIGLEYRAAGISKNYNCGFGVSSHINTPIAIDNGSQDVKHVLGEVDVEEDGSAYFEVPARTAVYFQMLDAKGRCVQTMRSWTMVLPGERVGCVGCHESKLQTALTPGQMPLALRRPAQRPQPSPGEPPHPLLMRVENTDPLEDVDAFLGVNRSCSIDPQARTDGFSYTQLIQPIWDRHCVRCHQGDANDRERTKRSALRLTGEIFQSPPGRELNGLRNFTQSYLALVARGPWTPLHAWVRGEMTASISYVLQGTKAQGEPLLSWVHPASLPPMLPPYSCGSSQSKFMDYLESSHYDVRLKDAEKRTVACWIDLAVPFCGSYGQANAWDRLEWRSFIQIESNTWNKPQKELYDYFQRKRAAFAKEEMENIKTLIKDTTK